MFLHKFVNVRTHDISRFWIYQVQFWTLFFFFFLANSIREERFDHRIAEIIKVEVWSLKFEVPIKN